MKNKIKEAVIGKMRINCLGTVSVWMKAATMRELEEFCVYPIQRGEFNGVITIQSDKRLGYIDLRSGGGHVTPSHANGAYSHHYMFDKINDKLQYFMLNVDDLRRLCMELLGTTDSNAGRNGVITCDNSGAIDIINL